VERYGFLNKADAAKTRMSGQDYILLDPCRRVVKGPNHPLSRRLHLYSPRRLTSFLHEQRLSLLACFDFPGSNSRLAASAGDVVGTLESLQHARKKFVDEIFFTTPCERGIIQDVLIQARAHGVTCA
jgi:hypothetical protein